MKVIANEALSLIANVVGEKENEIFEFDAGDSYEVEWYDAITQEDVNKACAKWKEEHPLEIMCPSFFTKNSFIEVYDYGDKYAIELTREQFEKWFSPVEECEKMHFHRIDLADAATNSERCSLVNKFIQDTNIKVEKIFEPNSNTIDIWYTKYIGSWE